jgi:hypothetical protein
LARRIAPRRAESRCRSTASGSARTMAAAAPGDGGDLRCRDRKGAVTGPGILRMRPGLVTAPSRSRQGMRSSCRGSDGPAGARLRGRAGRAESRRRPGRRRFTGRDRLGAVDPAANAPRSTTCSRCRRMPARSSPPLPEHGLGQRAHHGRGGPGGWWILSEVDGGDLRCRGSDGPAAHCQVGSLLSGHSHPSPDRRTCPADDPSYPQQTHSPEGLGPAPDSGSCAVQITLISLPSAAVHVALAQYVETAHIGR